MRDWEEGLSGKERQAWQRFIRHARREAAEKIYGSAYVMKGQVVPPGLRKVANVVIEMENDIEIEAGQLEMERKVKQALSLLGFDLSDAM